MIFVDTNILIRLITDDIPTLRSQAQQILSAHGPGELYVSDIVLTELFFVLQSSPRYGFSRAQVCEKLKHVLATPQFKITEAAIQAIEVANKQPRLDFTDCLLAVYADFKRNKLFTFDKALLAATK